ncbi:MAG: Holliday junction resolvase RuvX [Fimbriimonadia bacterium]
MLAVDPGTDKCGIAVARVEDDQPVQVLDRKVVQIGRLADTVAEMVEQTQPDVLVVGGGTGSRAVVRAIEARLPESGILVVDEKHSTERAQRRYWELTPRRGWRRFVPKGLLSPPEPIDDIAALVLAEDVLRNTAEENRAPEKA